MMIVRIMLMAVSPIHSVIVLSYARIDLYYSLDKNLIDNMQYDT